MMCNFFEILLRARKASEFSDGQDPKRTRSHTSRTRVSLSRLSEVGHASCPRVSKCYDIYIGDNFQGTSCYYIRQSAEGLLYRTVSRSVRHFDA